MWKTATELFAEAMSVITEELATSTTTINQFARALRYFEKSNSPIVQLKSGKLAKSKNSVTMLRMESAFLFERLINNKHMS